MMGMIRLPLILALAIGAGACSGADDTEDAPSRVEVWTPESPLAANDSAGVPGDDASGDRPAADGGATADSASSALPSEADSAPSTRDGGASSPPPPATTPAAGSAGSSLAGASAERILLRAERAYDAVRTMRATFVQDLTVPLLDETQRSRGEIFHSKPDRFLMRFSDPAGDVVVADGRNLWLYYPSTDPRQVIRTSAGEAGRLDLQREFLSDPTGRFDATLAGRAEVAGRPATELRLIPRGNEPYSEVRIWIDDQDALARRFEIAEANENVRRVELHDLRVNVELGDELFTFTPPAGAEVFDQ